MSNNVYALLIAIDNYRHPVPALSGCVQDSNEVQEYLEGVVSSDKLKLKVLRNEEATREKVIDAFLNHLSQADGDDSVFIHYSGHGSQEKTTSVFADLEPDGKNETLVLYDSRQTIEGVYHRDLADKELRALIHQVARKNPHIVSVFDCCHAGSNTRDTAKVTKRQASDDKTKARDLSDYVFMERGEFADTFQKEFADGKMLGSDLPTGSHIALQGALSSQTAKELVIDGKKRGAFTYAMLKYLKESQGDITYDELLSKVAPYVGKKVAEQNPQLDVVFSTKTTGSRPEKDMVFLKGTLKPADKSYLVNWDKDMNSWVVSAGQLNGIPVSGTTRFAIYDSKANIEANPSDYLQVAESKKILTTNTTISIEGNTTLDREATFKATILSLPITKTRVYFEAETAAQSAGLKLLKDAFKLNANAQKYLEEVTPDAEADYRVLAYEHEGTQKFGFYRPTDTRPLTDPLIGFNSRSAEESLKLLSGISRWDRTQTMENPTTKIKQDILQLEVEAHHFDPKTDQLLKVEPVKPNSKGEIVFPYQVYGEMTDSSWGRTPVYKIKVKNNSTSNKYHVAVLYMGSNFSIQNILFGQNIVGPGETLVTAGGDTLAPDVPEELIKQGIRKDTGYLKLVASTDDFKASLLEQDGFDYPQAERSLDGNAEANSFNMLLEGERTRSLMIRKPQKLSDWTTSLISFTNIWEDENAAADVLSKSKVSVKLPSGAAGSVKLSSLGHASRSVQAEMPGNGAMRSVPGSEPFELVEGQNTSPGMEILEIEGLDRSSVTKENPLVLTFDADLGEDDRLVIIQEEDGILLPWISSTNAAGKPEIELDRLPAPSTMDRSIGSSVKLMVHKMLGGKLGVSEFPLPRLGIPSMGTGEEPFEFDYDQAGVKSAVASADRIMLLVHGFTSSCKETYFDAMEDFPEQSLFSFLKKDGGYDLVLVFDYETLNTPITETAEKLKAQLAEVGLGEGHGKEFHVIGHSMGGLVSRTFIEIMGGNKIVSHLIMAGTPNGGSPWISIKQWALFASTLLLNGIPGLGWGLSVLGYLFGAVKVVDDLAEYNTDAMAPKSPFLNQLAQTPDPGIPYYALAGSITMIPDESDAKVGKILDKIGIGDPQFTALKKYLFKGENDIFVGVDSVNNIPSGRKAGVDSYKLPCNHFGFFVPDGGLKKLQELVLEIKSKPAAVLSNDGEEKDKDATDTSSQVSVDPGKPKSDPIETDVVHEETPVSADPPVKTEVPVGKKKETEVEVEVIPQDTPTKKTGLWAWIKSLFGL